MLIQNHCTAILEQVYNPYDIQPPLLVYTVVVLTGGDKHKKDVLITDFRPRDLEGKPVSEIDHKIIYLNPKCVTSKTPEPLREWLLAIADSLDEKVNVNNYQLDEIQRLFGLIEKDMISPEERAKMIEEYHQEQGKRTAFSEGLEEGVKQGHIQTAKKLLSMGMDIAMICQATELTEAEVLELQNRSSQDEKIN